MADLSIITAILPTSSEHIRATAQSILELKKLMTLEWIVVFDGPGANHILLPEADKIIHLKSHKSTAIARNIGLTQSSGKFVHFLDGDDLALPGLAESLNVLKDSPEIDWVAPNRTFIDGSKTVHWHDYVKEWNPGELAETWTTPFPFHPNSVIYRRSVVLLAGGVPAISPGDDMALILMVSETSPGRSITEVATAYRIWDGQAVQSEGFYERALIARKFLEECINAKRALDGKSLITAPEPARKSLSIIPLIDIKNN